MTASASETLIRTNHLSVTPLGDGIGADIGGFDFAALEAGQLDELRAAWLKYGVVRFRNCNITDEQQVRFTGMLGEFVMHPRQMKGEEGAHDTFEEILVIGNAKKDGKVAGTMANDEADWHTDTYIYDYPPAAAILRAILLPPSGGDTQFVSMYEVYDRLPAAIKRVIDGRLIQIDLVVDGTGRIRKGMELPDTEDPRLWPSIRHPLVRTHGESGRNCLYVGAEYSRKRWIVGLPLDESAAILAEISALITSPALQWTQQWEDGDMVMWDNRCTMHRRDGWDPQYTRTMHRTTTKGERPSYRM